MVVQGTLNMSNRIVVITQARSGSTLLINSIQSMLDGDMRGMNKATDWYLASNMSNQSTDPTEPPESTDPTVPSGFSKQNLVLTSENRLIDFINHCEDFNDIMKAFDHIRGFQEWCFKHNWVFRVFKSTLRRSLWHYWRYLAEDDTLKLIHLIRPNVLDLVVSRRVAHNSRSWHTFVEKTELYQVHIDIKLLKDTLEKEEFCTWYIDNNLSDVLRIEHNELVYDYNNTMNKVKDFCGLSKSFEHPGFKKNNPFPKKDVIINYNEVVSFLSGTKNEWMLYH